MNSSKGKFLSFLVCSLLFLEGCQVEVPAQDGTITPEPTPTKLACDTPGSVQSLYLEDNGHIWYSYILYLPPCYEIQANRYYPILYLVPGRGSIPEAWFGAGVAEIADDLILSNEIPPFIIVATEDTDVDMFAETITNDLMPTVESQLRVSNKRRHHSVAGGSLGGIAAYRIVFSSPDKFTSVGMFGSGAVSGEEPQIHAWLSSMNAKNKPRVFLNTGFEDTFMLERARVMLTLLDEFNIQHTHIFTPGRHNYTYWAQNLPAFFHWMALDW